MASLLSLRLLSALLLGVVAEPAPGRVPKVYNALITSNQNLEPSKAYPVYQPVLHDAFAFSFQPFFYGGDLVGNGILPPGDFISKERQAPETTPNSTPESLAEGQTTQTTTETTVTTPEPTKPESNPNNPTPAPPSPPSTLSPIPLNEFGLPPQVLPLSHINPIFNTLPQFSPFTYRYPGIKFYDPYDSFGYSPYASIPSIYRPLPNVLGPALGPIVIKSDNSATPTKPSAQTPPPEPNDLNILNYSSRDPAIPNVPPPPLPQGGLKTDTSE